jgi:surfeit locus 1 family protein
VSVFKAIFSRQWILASLLVVVGTLVMIRLGFWQLDRMEQRQVFNARVQAQIDQEPLTLNASLQSQETPNLIDMEYRQVEVVGQFDHGQEVVLRNQAWNNQLGVRLLTPLRIEGSDLAILVDRGWIPHEDYVSGQLEQYAEPGIREIKGRIRRSQTRPDIGRRTDPELGENGEKLQAYFLANVDQISAQIPYPLLPVYIQAATEPGISGPPHRNVIVPELTEGSHLGYALQWFTFALILFAGYPFFVKREMQKGDPPQTKIGDRKEQKSL